MTTQRRMYLVFSQLVRAMMPAGTSRAQSDAEIAADCLSTGWTTTSRKTVCADANGPVRDFQRSRVYRWERSFVHDETEPEMPLAACRALVAEVYLWAEGCHGGLPPRVTDGRGRRHAGGSREVIKLPRWSRRRSIVLHECAHGLAHDRHGPQFVACYIALLQQFAGMDPEGLRQSAILAGVKIATPPSFPIEPTRTP